jgi:glycine cleavage system H protein
VVNNDPYGEGWIIKIEVSNPSDIDTLMSSEEYKNLIGS